MTITQSNSAFTSVSLLSQPSNIVSLDVAARVRITDPIRRWRDAVVSRLNDLVALERGWNGYTGEAVKFENANFALRMLEASCGVEAPVPQIVPGVAGDLQVEWHIGSTDIELDIRGPNEVHAWVCSEHTGPDGQEFDLTNDFTNMAEWIRDLSESSNASSTAAA
jgi:hypothetical protein